MRQSEIERLLPGIFQRTLAPGEPLDALLGLMEALHAPIEERFAEIDACFDPRRTPERFVAFLGAWVDLRRVFEIPAPFQVRRREAPRVGAITRGSLRELIAAAASLSQWRGTARGLVRFLEIATGLRGFEIGEDVRDASGRRVPFAIVVRAPAGARAQEELIRDIVRMEKPAHVTAEFEFADREREQERA
ncbi:MAG: phage tail protein [Myxococcota bacterium]|nr:phage tail protein [Myxococcota bacterium]